MERSPAYSEVVRPNSWNFRLASGVNLEWGILACCFAGARCPDCGHDFLVSFSCKGRRLCPSCNARRMAQTAAALSPDVVAGIVELAHVRVLRWFARPQRADRA
jgi:uncharacterized protein (DUF983 family)